jgi:acyl-CoA hydrolase
LHAAGALTECGAVAERVLADGVPGDLIECGVANGSRKTFHAGKAIYSFAAGTRRMYENGESIFYYITLYKEKYAMEPMPKG